jgi:hypothetical protein
MTTTLLLAEQLFRQLHQQINKHEGAKAFSVWNQVQHERTSKDTEIGQAQLAHRWLQKYGRA